MSDATAGLRLTAAEIAAIKRIVAQHFGADAEVRVFGSRTRPEVLGGDLDLIVTLPRQRPPLRTVLLAEIDIEHALDGLSTDLVVVVASEPRSLFERRVLTESLSL